MRKFGAIVVALSMLTPDAFAAGNAAPLAPGKPAGVKQAQELQPLALWIAGFAIIGGGIALAVSGNNNHVTTTTISTTTTS